MRVRLKHQKLAELIAASPLSQNHWAIKLGLSRGHFSDLVNGKHPFPSTKTRTLLLDTFDVPHDLLFENDPGADAWADLDFRRAIAEHFLIDAEIGQGGMGAVYQARDLRHGRLVAVKVIAPEAVGGIGPVQFQGEISTLAQLTHPNIIPLHEAGNVAGQPYFVMPYVRSGSLRGLLDRAGRLTIDGALPLIRGISGALDYAHSQHVLHCDVKPENILIHHEHVWVTDFGIARRLRSESGMWPRRSGIDISAGTPAYVSPEQASGDVELDARSDVYSLGCVVFEMLSGRSPFQGSNTQQIVSRRFVGPPPNVRAIAPEVPATVAEVLERAMALQRDKRPATAADFVRELEDAVLFASSAAARIKYTLWRGVSAAERALHLSSRHKPGLIMRSMAGALGQDIRFGARMLRKNFGFTFVAVLTLALGIGANTAVFSVVNAVLLRPLPFRAPDQLVALGQSDASNRTSLSQFSFRNFADVREQSRSFERMAAYYTNSMTLTGQGEALRLRGAVVTSELLPLLGAVPARGRLFNVADDAPGGGADGYAAILSWQTWQQQFGADPKIVGRVIRFDGVPYTVVGVMPEHFGFPIQSQPVEVWITPARDAERTGDGAMMVSRGYRGFRVVGRLAEGATVAQAQAETRRIASGLATQFPEANKDLGINVMSLHEWLVGDTRLTLILILGTVGVVLLIACSNVAHLLLERAVARQREVTLRLALGASRWRIGRQHLTEVLMLTLASGVLGALFATAGTSVLKSLSPGGILRMDEATLDGRVFAFTAVVSLVVGLVFGLMPALRVSTLNLAASMKGAGGGRSRGSQRAHNVLIVAEVALSLVLLIGAGLLVRTLQRMQDVPLGFDTRNLLTMTVAPSMDDNDALIGFYNQLTERAAALPGVVGASVTWQLPLSGTGATSGVHIDGRPEDPASNPSAILHTSSPGYFQTMGIVVKSGRDFTIHDDMRSPPVIIINETFARQQFPNGDAIGKKVIPGYSSIDAYNLREIVGVVGDVKHHGMRSTTTPEIYMPQAQMPVRPLTLVVRTKGDPVALVSPLRQLVQSMDPNAPVYAVRTADEYLSRAVAPTRFNMTLLTAFAVIALVMTAVGLYGVISFSVTQSTRDIGIRAALGARSLDTLLLVIGQGIRLTVIGVVLGVAVGIGASRVMSSLVFEVATTDVATFASVAMLLIVVATLACYIPARRATTVDPMVALRSE